MSTRTITVGAAIAVWVILLVPGFVPVEFERQTATFLPAELSAYAVKRTCISDGRIGVPAPANLTAAAILVADADSGEILYERNADESRAPASITKLFTMNRILEALENGDLTEGDWYPVPPESFASRMEPDSSLMFLGPNQRVTVDDILSGLAVASGNDAAVAAAVLVAGSVAGFMDEVNANLDVLGFSDTLLVEPSGISAENRTTARDLAMFGRYITLRWPDTFSAVLARREFSYPRRENMVVTGGEDTPGAVIQRNRNSLLWEYEGTDGMKTGYIDESGYNLIARARRNGRTLIVVLMGIDATDHQEGGRIRSREAIALFDWAFDNFVSLQLSFPDPGGLDVAGSRTDITVFPGIDPVLTVPAGTTERLEGRVEVDDQIWAPLQKGETLGKVVYRIDGCTVLSVPLVASATIDGVDPASLWLDRYRTRVTMWLAGNN